jgi:tRNA(Arg) A34 adenosine deaminase TadA
MHNVWEEISTPWQACLELAWKAYCDDCVPIGAVVTDAKGNILSRGRNRVYPRWMWEQRPSPGAEIAHAELEALQKLDYSGLDQHSCILYTTTEPCPMCMGAIYMSGVRTLNFAARDPFAGSINMLGTTWYLERKSIKVFGPDQELEMVIVALFVEHELCYHAGKLPDGIFWEMYGNAFPEWIALGRRLYEQGELIEMRKSGLNARCVFEHLVQLVR